MFINVLVYFWCEFYLCASWPWEVTVISVYLGTCQTWIYLPSCLSLLCSILSTHLQTKTSFSSFSRRASPCGFISQSFHIGRNFPCFSSTSGFYMCLQSLLISYSLYYQILGSFQYIKCSTVMPVSKKNVVSTWYSLSILSVSFYSSLWFCFLFFPCKCNIILPGT